MNFDIFHAYDIRGIYPAEVNEDVFYKIALGYAAIFKPKTVAVGMDARLSSPSLKESVIKALLDSGIDVVDIGEMTTDMIYFAVGFYDYSGGIIISASHNPGQYNGLKLVREKAAAISSDTGLFELRDALKENRIPTPPPKKRGSLKKKDILNDYIKHVLSFVDRSAIRPFRFVANGNFGFVGKPVKRIVNELGLTMIPLNFEPDGSFPKGAPDPLLPENRKETEELVKKSNVDIGVSWDADADRVMFFDEKGRFISGVYIGALLSKIVIKKYGKGIIICDPRTIWPVLNTVKQWGSEAVVSKCGHTFMKDKMRSMNALFATEMSAHYYFRDNYYADSGIIPFLLVLEHLSKEGKKFSEIMDPFREGHFISGELNYRVKDIKPIIEKIVNLYKNKGKTDMIDGFSVETDEWRFNIRPSNTEPLMRLNVEAKRPELVDKIKDEIVQLIHS
ncbi:MAG: phosphomannomutase/phosphoglucomutase [Candidatus Aminicenantes bacterium]|nr:phosphomannomutase/phosphoglucomutase [Candidatus Aminicenantes bacterium]